MGIFESVEKEIKKKYNSNFYFDKLEWGAQIWIKEICNQIDLKLNKSHTHYDSNGNVVK